MYKSLSITRATHKTGVAGNVSIGNKVLLLFAGKCLALEQWGNKEAVAALFFHYNCGVNT